ncbi:MAG: phage baseplate plug family protein [Minisyncoccia bacterium]
MPNLGGLEGCSSLEFEWIESRGFWMLHIADENPQPLALGLMLQPDWPIYTHHGAARPLTFMLLARSPGQVLGRQNLGRHFTLVACEAL